MNVRVGDIVKFKYHGADAPNGEVLIGRVDSVGTTYVKPFHTNCVPIFYVKVMDYSMEFIVNPEDVIEVFITPEVVNFT